MMPYAEDVVDIVWGANTCSESASHCNARRNVSYYDCSISTSTDVLLVTWMWGCSSIIDQMPMHFWNTALSQTAAARPEVACVRGITGTGQSSDASCRDAVWFSLLPSNDLDAILTPCTVHAAECLLLANPGSRGGEEDSLWSREGWRGEWHDRLCNVDVWSIIKSLVS